MHSFNLLCFTLVCLTESFALKIEEVFFPIRNFSDDIISFVDRYTSERPRFDVRRVSIWNQYVQDRRMLSRLEKYNNTSAFLSDPYNDHYKLPSMSVSIHSIPFDWNVNYKIEDHSVETEDGYILVLHRIIRNNQPSDWVGAGVVYIQHGLLLSSDAYMLRVPKYNLAIILSDNNYDVWLGNARGNAYSRSHKYLTIDDSDFWNFSFHEIGVQDLRCSIDYVLNITKYNYLNFIGYSIGATASYVLLSNFPEYNTKIRLLISISPLLFWERPNNDTDEIDQIIEKMEKLRDSDDPDGTRTGEIYPLSSYMAFFSYVHKSSCPDLPFSTFFGDLSRNFDHRICMTLAHHMPAGTSIKTLIHLLQIIKTGRFQEYDEGHGFNEEYDLTKIKLIHAIFVGPNKNFFIKRI